MTKTIFILLNFKNYISYLIAMSESGNKEKEKKINSNQKRLQVDL